LASGNTSSVKGQAVQSVEASEGVDGEFGESRPCRAVAGRCEIRVRVLISTNTPALVKSQPRLLFPTTYAPLLADLKARVRAAQVKAAAAVNRELMLSATNSSI
jgi:hypothetical protein